MIPIPWKHIKSWACITCGMCCTGFNVVLRFNEWLNIVRKFGVEATKPGIDKLYISKKVDGTCFFLYKLFDKCFCGLQHTKPRACKLWPFKIYRNPRYGNPHNAAYSYGEKKFFVYVDPFCLGVRPGTPSREFTHKTLPEFVEIGLGIREKQHHSTSKMFSHQVVKRSR